MKYLSSGVTITLALLCSGSLIASPVTDGVAAFKKALKEEYASKPPPKEPDDPPSPADANTSYLLSLMASLDRISSQLDTPNTVNNMEMQINQIVSAFPASERVEKTGRELLSAIYQERKTRVSTAAAEMQAILQRLSETAPKAVKAAELDEILDALQRIKDDRYSYYTEDASLFQRVAVACEFTRLWQDYLSHRAAGQNQLALTDLQNINQNNYGANIIPRSLLLDRLAAAGSSGKPEAPATPPEVAEILKGVTTLDEMEPALKRLAALPQSNAQTARACANLAPLVQVYTNVKASLPEIANLSTASANNELSISPALRSQLLMFILQHYFDSSKGAAPGETPQSFVDRVIADAANREDWTLLRKAVAGQSYLNRNSALNVYATGNISSGIESLIAGVNQEAAGQYAKAVASYQNALTVADITGTVKLIGDKLAAIKKDHPKEYEDGMKPVPPPQMVRNSPGPETIDGPPSRPLPPIPGAANPR